VESKDSDGAEEEFYRVSGAEFREHSSPSVEDVQPTEDGRFTVIGTIEVPDIKFLNLLEERADEILGEHVPADADVDYVTANRGMVWVRGDYKFPTRGREEIPPEDQTGYFAVPDEVRNEASQALESFFGHNMPIDDLGEYAGNFVASYSGELFRYSPVVQKAVQQAKSEYSPTQDWDSFEPQ
jgi:hypothetical protein